MKITDEINELFETARLKLGGGIRKVEITDKAMCACLELAMRKYNQYVLNFVIQNNWANFYGKNANMSNSELAFAFSIRTLDITKDYSDYFSHFVGLQQHGTKWELKKDFFKIIPGQQVYVVPAGRAINKVLHFTNATTDVAMLATYYGGAYGFGSGVMGQLGGAAAGAFAGMPGLYGLWAPFYAAPLYDVALASTNMKEKNKFLGCDLTYKVTAGPDGTHLIHLTNVPGSPFDKMGGFGRLHECYCWYTYYDVSGGDIDDCMNENPEVILSPDQIKLKGKDYSLLNDAAKSIVTQIFIGEVAETVGLVRGKFSGNLNMIASPVTMDYNMMLTIGKAEKESGMNDLKERLQEMSPYKMAEKEAELTKNIIEARKGTPLKMYVR
jgi:hypothetical protein